MRNPKLSEIALQEAESKLSDQSSDCVMQLLCRGSPIIKGMQTSLSFFLSKPTSSSNSLKGETSSSEFSESDELIQMKHSWKQQTPVERLFFFMPSLTDFESIGKLCKQKYNNCWKILVFEMQRYPRSSSVKCSVVEWNSHGHCSITGPWLQYSSNLHHTNVHSQTVRCLCSALCFQKPHAFLRKFLNFY